MAQALDRWLDGEADAASEARWEAALRADPALAARVAERRAFLALLGSARVGSPALPGAVPAGLEARIRAALPREAAPRPLRLRRGAARAWWAGAAAACVAAAVWLGQGGEEATAFDPVRRAADLLRWRPKSLESVGTCAGGPQSEVHAFSLVREGAFEVTGCVPGTEGASVALLRRPEQLPAVGYVAVPDDGARPAGEVGVTEVEGGRVLVFDVLDHGRRVYLAVDPAALGDASRAARAEQGWRWSCAACHGPVRQVAPNPHRIVLRKTP